MQTARHSQQRGGLLARTAGPEQVGQSRDRPLLKVTQRCLPAHPSLRGAQGPVPLHAMVRSCSPAPGDKEPSGEDARDKKPPGWAPGWWRSCRAHLGCSGTIPLASAPAGPLPRWDVQQQQNCLELGGPKISP